MSTETWRLVLRPLSTFLTGLHSDTILGHLAWMAAYRDGTEIDELVRRFRADPPFVLSSGFPHDWLPAPVLPPLGEEEKERLALECFPEPDPATARARLQVALRKIAALGFLPMTDWRQLARGLDAFGLARHLLGEPPAGEVGQAGTSSSRRADVVKARLDAMMQEQTVMRTAVDRLTGSGLEGRLYDHNETGYSREARIDVWFRFFDPGYKDKVLSWLEDLAVQGFGANASSGAGRFEILSFQRTESLLPEAEEGNAFMALSHFVPAAGDPVSGWYHHMVKRGKLGGTMACSPPPGAATSGAHVWKHPLIMLTPGSVFRHNGRARLLYGRIVENIYPPDNRIVQFAHCFPFQVHLP